MTNFRFLPFALVAALVLPGCVTSQSLQDPDPAEQAPLLEFVEICLWNCKA